MVGLGRSLCLDPDFSKKILQGNNLTSVVRPLTTGSSKLDKLLPLEIIWYTEQIHRMGRGKNPNPNLNVLKVILKNATKYGLQSLKRVRGKS